MILEQITVLNYKNIRQHNLHFSPKINAFIGENGIGKTNLLDGIYHLGLSKSYFNTQSVQNILHGEEFYLLEGSFLKDQRNEHLVFSFKKGQKKTLKRNGKNYEKISEHIGSFPVVIVSPYDADLISQGSEERRKFLDTMLSQLSAPYLEQLLHYNRTLAQRNALLKLFASEQYFDPVSLSIYDQQLAYHGSKILQERKNFLEEFVKLFVAQYQQLSGGKESVSVSYQSSLQEENFLNSLQRSLEKDKTLGYTSQGIHKDDLLFTLSGYPIKKFGSQGQQKSFLIALKLAQFQLIRNKTNTTPLLLLDDIFDKLDPQRVSHLLQIVHSNQFGQVFLSDTDKERTQGILLQNFPPENFKIFDLHQP